MVEIEIFDGYGNCPVCGKRYLQYPPLSPTNRHYGAIKYCSKNCAVKSHYIRLRSGIGLIQERRTFYDPQNIKDKNRLRSLSRAKIKVDGKVCFVCGSTKKLQRHHPDYTKPLEVVILCSICHHQLLKTSLSSTK